MANLGANPAWKSVEDGTAKNDVKIKGYDYSYTDNIPKPETLGVGSSGSFGQLYTNLGATGTYVKAMTAGGAPLGNAYFLNTGGTCTAPDGSTQTRMNFINNVSSGLLVGALSDIGGLNPSYLFSSLSSDGTPACSCYSCPTTDGPKFGFLTPELSPDFDKKLCRVVDSSNCTGKTKETFANNSMPALPVLLLLGGLLLLTFSGK